MTTEKDTDVYMKKIRKRGSETGSVMEKIKSDRMAELDKMRVEAEMEEVKAKIAENRAKIRDAQTTGQPLQPGQAQNYLQMLFAGRKPEEVKEILSSLTEEEIDKLAYLTSAMSNSNLANFRGFLRQPSTGAKEVLEAVKTGVEVTKAQSSGMDLKGIAEIFKAGVEAAKAQTPPQPQTSSHEKLLERALDEAKAWREEVSKQNMARLEKEIAELKARPGFAEELAQKKAEFTAFREWIGGGATPNLEMQKLSLDHEKWKIETDWRIQKELADMKLKQQSDRDKWKTIKAIVTPALKRAGPLIDASVKAGQRKISTVAPPQVPRTQAATAFLCPECAKKGVQSVIDVSDVPEVAKCETCGAEFPRAQG